MWVTHSSIESQMKVSKRIYINRHFTHLSDLFATPKNLMIEIDPLNNACMHTFLMLDHLISFFTMLIFSIKKYSVVCFVHVCVRVCACLSVCI